ncbi:MAG: hypothetical protein E6Q24_10245 [Chitinophagaceae bacterium]|jgi:hypothetical protein|nr:hypothetical protein [Sphingobacteriales bacterium]OJW02949.1 MAG: hypothetical protein BGO52_01180 [Sphingobacteriales bacterium 44-61]TXJ27288.1 MAG: hypothetical protein E6Q24_10245 [Chitinophagaceae bacterium]
MKRFLFILSLFVLTTAPILAQDDDDVDDNATIRDKMSEYIQERLKLSPEEAKKFKPVFIEYFKDWKKTARENRGDNLVMRQKITDLQVKYRARFKEIVGEQRSNLIFTHQRGFIQELRRLRQERLKNNPGKRNPEGKTK